MSECKPLVSGMGAGVGEVRLKVSFLGFGDVELLLTKYVTLQVVAFDSLSLESMPYPRYAGSVAGPYTRPLLSSTLSFYVGYTLWFQWQRRLRLT